MGAGGTSLARAGDGEGGGVLGGREGAMDGFVIVVVVDGRCCSWVVMELNWSWRHQAVGKVM